MKDFFFIVNPVSRGGRTAKFLREKLPWVKANMPGAKVVESSYAGEAIVLARQAGQAGYRNCISVGGDGTLNEVINGVLSLPKKSQPQIGILSSGTGGDFFRFLKERYAIPANWDWLKHSKGIAIDIGHASLETKGQSKVDRYFVNMADMGLSGEVMKIVNQSSGALGSLEYLRASLLAAWSYHAPRVKLVGFVSDEGGVLSEIELLLLVVANGRFFGGGMCIAPEAELDDHSFQFLVAEKIPYLSLVFRLPALYRRKRLRHERIHYGHGKKIAVEASRGRITVNLDGEVFQAERVTLELCPQELKILIPKRKNPCC